MVTLKFLSTEPRLSGYKHTKHSAPPGIKTMWTALKIFYPITQMFYLMSTKT